LPVLETLQVTDFRDDSSCRLLSLPRGTFVDARSEDGCDPVDKPSQPFDDDSRGDLARVAAALQEAGVRVTSITAAVSDEGTITSAFFDVGCGGCELGRYIYEAQGVAIDQDLVGISWITQRPLTETWMWLSES
jgi:hypothetical protein